MWENVINIFKFIWNDLYDEPVATGFYRKHF